MSEEEQQEQAQSDDFSKEESEKTMAQRTLNGREILLTPPIAQMIEQQSVPLEGNPEVRRSPRVKDGQFLHTVFDDVHSVHDMFIHGYKISKDENCLGWRPTSDASYTWITYQEVYDKVHKIGSGLIAKGAETNSTQFIGIYSQNNVEWVVMDHACAAYSMVSVPLYDTLGADALSHIVTQCDLSIILIDTNVRARKILEDKKSGRTSSIRLIILIQEPDEDTKSLCSETGVEIMTQKEVEEIGSKSLKDFIPPKPDDLYTICYTSGTTGTPKGVMHSHLNIVSMASAFLANQADYYQNVQPSDVHLSYLPLAHVFERYGLHGVLMQGAKVGFYAGNPKQLLNDAAALKPTIFLLVPRLINRIYGKIMEAVGQSAIKRFLFNICLRRKMAALENGRVSNDTFWDKIVFHKFQAVLGGRVRISATGAAPISSKVLNVVRCVMGIPILEGYGSTESTSANTCTLFGDYEGGHVGSLLPCSEFKLVDVPEKDYFAKDGKGEICIRGPGVFLGYYKDEAKTKETIDSDGWLHTGDIGQWLPNGALKIIDRRKNIFKLSQGEYIAPEKIEQIYLMSDPVLQVYVHGNSLKSCVIAIVVADEEALSSWCKHHQVHTEDKSVAELCQMEKVKELILEDMNKYGRENGLKSFELAKKIFVTSEQFTIENGMMTPSLKTRRTKVEQCYQAELDRMYEGLD